MLLAVQSMLLALIGLDAARGRLRKASQNLLKHECGNPGIFEKPPPPESLWEQISNPQAHASTTAATCMLLLLPLLLPLPLLLLPLTLQLVIGAAAKVRSGPAYY